MEIVKSPMKLTPEERRQEVRRRMYIQLRAVEMRRRERVALEIAERCQREKERKEKMRQDRDQLKKERLQWKKGMLVQEELVTRPRSILTTLEKQPKVEDKAGPKCLTSDLKAKEQRKRKILYNNWVGEQNTDSEPVKETPHPDNCVYSLLTAKPSPEPEEKQATPNSDRPVQERLTTEHLLRLKYLLEIYQAHREKMDKSHILKSEEQNVGASCPRN